MTAGWVSSLTLLDGFDQYLICWFMVLIMLLQPYSTVSVEMAPSNPNPNPRTHDHMPDRKWAVRPQFSQLTLTLTRTFGLSSSHVCWPQPLQLIVSMFNFHKHINVGSTLNTFLTPLRVVKLHIHYIMSPSANKYNAHSIVYCVVQMSTFFWVSVQMCAIFVPQTFCESQK